LLACGKCYAQNTRFTTVTIDQPTGHQRYIIHVIEQHPNIQLIPLLNRNRQVQFIDSSGKARRKRIVYRYANEQHEQSDRLLDHPLSDKALTHVIYSQPIQRQGQPISFVRQQTYNDIFWLVVKLISIVRERTSINWPSSSRENGCYSCQIPATGFVPLQDSAI
jgi:hypothetical protein